MLLPVFILIFLQIVIENCQRYIGLNSPIENLNFTKFSE